MADHLSQERLQAAAAGDEEQRQAAAAHLAECQDCRQRLSQLLGVIEAGAEELLAARPGCPSAADLAEIPAGGEWDHPHVADCLLCQQELDLIRSLQTMRLLGEVWADGPPARPQQLVPQTSAYIQDAPGGDNIVLELQPGTEGSGRLAGVAVSVTVSAEEVVIDVAAAPRQPLQAILESEQLVRKVELLEGRNPIPLRSWRRLTVFPAGGER